MNIDKVLRFENAVSRQWAWRFHELDKFLEILFESEKKFPEPLPNNKENLTGLLYRMGILLLYSHWEGFIKETAKAYMECFKGEKIKDVPRSIFIAHFIKIHSKYSKICTAYECRKSVLENINMDSQIKSDIGDLVSTESNLDSIVLSKISSFLGLGKEWFELKEKYINKFIDCRNSIAHGEGKQVSKEDFYEYFKEIKELLVLYKENLLDCCKTENT